VFEVRVHVAFHALSETLVDVVHRSQIPLVLSGLYFHETVVVTSLRNDTPLFVHSFTFRRKKLMTLGFRNEDGKQLEIHGVAQRNAIKVVPCAIL
jgi:hypothetical protein